MRPSRLSLAVSVLSACVLATPAPAYEILSGTLRKARETGAITLGVREASLPFSFRDATGSSVGYAVDLCREVAEDVGREIGRPNLAIRMVPVTSESRFPKLQSGEIDIECGSTTANGERRKSFAFSPVTYFSATKLLVRRDSTVKSYRDLGDRRIAVTAGTTNEGALRSLFARLNIAATIVTGKDHAESFAMVRDGRADALGLDDVLLYGLIAGAGQDGATFTVLPDKLSFEPYGLMFRKDDPEFASVVASTFSRLAESRELRWIYERWFLKRLPNGERLNVPMSDELRTNFQVIGLEN